MCTFAANTSSVFVLLVRLGICAIFLAAGIGKLLDPGLFFDEIGNYQLLPEQGIPAVVWFLPTLEIVTAGVLLCNVWVKEACWILLGLMVLFTLAILSAWVRGLNIECGCFGALGSWGSYPWWILRNLLLAAGLVYLAKK